MTNKYISKLNGLITNINEDEIKSQENLEAWCDKWREAATECSVALFTEISCLRHVLEKYNG